jgi:hypothetical protein
MYMSKHSVLDTKTGCPSAPSVKQHQLTFQTTLLVSITQKLSNSKPHIRVCNHQLGHGMPKASLAPEPKLSVATNLVRLSESLGLRAKRFVILSDVVITTSQTCCVTPSPR